MQVMKTAVIRKGKGGGRGTTQEIRLTRTIRARRKIWRKGKNVKNKICKNLKVTDREMLKHYIRLAFTSSPSHLYRPFPGGATVLSGAPILLLVLSLLLPRLLAAAAAARPLPIS